MTPMETARIDVIETAPVRFVPAGARLRRRGKPIEATLLLTVDELVVVRGSEQGGEVLMRQARNDLAMARHPAPRGGEQVELSALDGQEATLRFDRRHARAAETIVAWLAGVWAA